MERIVEQRYSAAVEAVERLRNDYPDDDVDALVSKLMRACARDLALGGAVSGGAAAAPRAGAAGMAANMGAEVAIGAGRLGEMVMAIGILHGLEDATTKERATWLAAILGVSEGAAAGLTGVAARAGSKAGGRMLSKVAAAGAMAGAGRTRRAAGRMATKGGPWSLAALIPYGIGAGVGAASNAALAWSVGRASRRYFATHPGGENSEWKFSYEEEIWEAEFVEERFTDDDPDKTTAG